MVFPTVAVFLGLGIALVVQPGKGHTNDTLLNGHSIKASRLKHKDVIEVAGTSQALP